jgi:uncharacterized iron-regulated protein
MLHRLSGFSAIAAVFVACWSGSAIADESHPLAGTAWTGSGTPTTIEAVIEKARAADFVLVGEIHTNPDHHAFQARIIRAIAETGRRPSVVLEMVPQRLQRELDAFNAAGTPDAAALGAALDWENRGWPDWSIYQPIAQAAADAGLPLMAGDLDRDAIRAIGREPGELGYSYDPAARASLETVLKVSHCDMLPDAAITAMVAVQQARDVSMAQAMVAAGQDGAVLITGAGHARTDWGVPFILGRIAPERTVFSIGLIESVPGADTFADYPGEDATRLPFDMVIFTSRTETEDPCAAMAEQMGK